MGDAACGAGAAIAATVGPAAGRRRGSRLPPLEREFHPDGVSYPHVQVETGSRRAGARSLTWRGPDAVPADLAGIHAPGAAFWPLAMARELDDAILHLRLNEPELGLIVLRTEGDPAAVLAADALLEAHTGGLAGAGDPPAAEARAQAAGHDLAQPDRADRAGKLLCRHAGGARVRRRSLGDAGGTRTARPARRRCTCRR